MILRATCFVWPSTLAIALALAATPIAGARQDDPLAGAREAAWGAYHAGDFETARRLAQEILDADEADAWSHVLLGKVLEDSGDWGDVPLLRAEELAGDDVDVIGVLADTWAARYAQILYSESADAAPESRSVAERLYRRWAAITPESPLPLRGLASLRQTAGDAEGALGLLFAAVAIDPNVLAPHNDLWAHLGADLTYTRLAAFYEGLACAGHDPATRALCRDYGSQVIAAHARERMNAASVAASEGDRPRKVNALQQAKDLLATAIEAMRDASRIDPSRAPMSARAIAGDEVAVAEVYRDLGDLNALLRHVESARESMAAAFRANPDDPTVRAHIDNLPYQLFLLIGGEAGQADDPGRYVKASSAMCDYWQWAVEELDPSNAPWWNNVGFFARESERYEESFTAYRTLVDLAPDDVRALNDTALILLYHLHRDYDEAERLLQKAFALGAEQYPATKDDAEAEAFLRSAWGDAMLNLGLLYLETGRYDEAETALANLSELDGGRFDLLAMKARLAIARQVAAAGEAELRAMVADAIGQLRPGREGRAARARLADLADELRAQRERVPGAAELLRDIQKALNDAGAGR